MSGPSCYLSSCFHSHRKRIRPATWLRHDTLVRKKQHFIPTVMFLQAHNWRSLINRKVEKCDRCLLTKQNAMLKCNGPPFWQDWFGWGHYSSSLSGSLLLPWLNPRVLWGHPDISCSEKTLPFQLQSLLDPGSSPLLKQITEWWWWWFVKTVQTILENKFFPQPFSVCIRQKGVCYEERESINSGMTVCPAGGGVDGVMEEVRRWNSPCQIPPSKVHVISSLPPPSSPGWHQLSPGWLGKGFVNSRTTLSPGIFLTILVLVAIWPASKMELE